MDMVIYRLNSIIKGLRIIKEEMEDEGLIDFKNVNVDQLISKAKAAKLAVIDFVENSYDSSDLEDDYLDESL